MTKYALYTYTTENIGDEIQSIAARRFLPQVDYYVNRDELKHFQPETDEEVKIIMNGWYSHKPENIAISQDNIHGLVTSMFIADHVKNAFSESRGEQLRFLQQHQPIGARNVDTQRYLETLGLETYFSGCMTLTLQKEHTIKKQNFILAVDLPVEVITKLKHEADCPVIEFSASLMHDVRSVEARFRLAEYILVLFQSARCVVTTRLHATLPCLALETPVLNIDISHESERFTGLRELAHHMTVEEFLTTNEYDVNQPPANPTDYIPIREALIEKCREFTGYDSPGGFLHGETVEELFMSRAFIQSTLNGFYADKMAIGSVIP